MLQVRPGRDDAMHDAIETVDGGDASDVKPGLDQDEGTNIMSTEAV